MMSEPVFPAGLGGAIAYMDNVFDPFFCDSLTSFLHQEDNRNLFERGVTADPTLEGHKISVDAVVGGNILANKKQNEILQMYSTYIFDRLGEVLVEYTKNYFHFDCWTNRFDSGYRYQFYKKGTGQYKMHCDGSVFDNPGYRERVLGCVVYLNTVEDGGSTFFPLHDVRINAVKGRVSLFPANFNYPHIGEMPMSDDKHIISTFFTSPVTREIIDQYLEGNTFYPNPTPPDDSLF